MFGSWETLQEIVRQSTRLLGCFGGEPGSVTEVVVVLWEEMNSEKN